MNLESIMVSERSQSWKIMYECMNLFTLNVLSSKSIEIESKLVIDQSWGESKQEWLLMSIEFLFWVENILKLIVVRVTQFCECTKNHWLTHFKWLHGMACVRMFFGYKFFHFANWHQIIYFSLANTFLIPAPFWACIHHSQAS